MQTKRLPKIKPLETFGQAESYVRAYTDQLMRFKKVEQVMNDLKQDFNATMERYFIESDCESPLEFTCDGESRSTNVRVSRVAPKKIIWDLAALRALIGKRRAAKVVRKRYEISDFAGLVEYLKSCGVDPKQFKSFLNITETVDEKELDRLFDLGEFEDLEQDDLMDCCTVEEKPVYFRVTVSSDGE